MKMSILIGLTEIMWLGVKNITNGYSITLIIKNLEVSGQILFSLKPVSIQIGQKSLENFLFQKVDPLPQLKNHLL